MSHITYLAPFTIQAEMDAILEGMNARSLGRGSISVRGQSVSADLLIQLATGKTVGFRRTDGTHLELVTDTGDAEAEAEGRSLLNRAVVSSIHERLPRTRLSVAHETALPDGSIQMELRSVDTPSASVRLDLTAGGEARVETFGVTGPRCKVMTQEIESVIGKVVRVVRKTDQGGGKVAVANR